MTFVIGRNDTGGNTTPEGVVIGLETMCRATWMGADVAARFVHIIAHEMAHVQQLAAQADTPGGTLLFQSLIEGGADFVGELGYWVGYRIAKAYYANASDKKQAIADLLDVNNDNAAAFLERSGWRPQSGCRVSGWKRTDLISRAPTAASSPATTACRTRDGTA